MCVSYLFILMLSDSFANLPDNCIIKYIPVDAGVCKI